MKIYSARELLLCFPWMKQVRIKAKILLLFDIIGKHKTVQMKEKCLHWHHKKVLAQKKLGKGIIGFTTFCMFLLKKPFIDWKATGVLFIWSFSLFDDQVNSFNLSRKKVRVFYARSSLKKVSPTLPQHCKFLDLPRRSF